MQSSLRNPQYRGRPVRSQRIAGNIQSQNLEMYDLTAEQYNALIHLTAALTALFPRLPLAVPRDPATGNNQQLTANCEEPFFIISLSLYFAWFGLMLRCVQALFAALP